MRQPPPLLLDTRLFSISQINNLPDEQRQQVYRRLVPGEVLQRFGIDPETLSDGEGRSLLDIECSSGASSVEISLRHAWDAPDPMIYLQMADTPNNQIEVILFIINNPYSERFDTDRLPDGTPTYFGTLERNIEEEIRAMEAGLAPGQVRSGLSLARRLIPTLEWFVTALNHDAVYIQPLAYHNAILFERLGFSYMLGHGPDGMDSQRVFPWRVAVQATGWEHPIPTPGRRVQRSRPQLGYSRRHPQRAVQWRKDVQTGERSLWRHHLPCCDLVGDLFACANQD